jgi:large exoprotein involved in heme utilization and adhesion
VLKIRANDSIEVIGRSVDGESSVLTAAVEQGGIGQGGSIELETGRLNVQEGGVITSRSEGQNNAGNININAHRSLLVNNGEISTNSVQAGGGNIDITARNIFLRSNGDIRTNSTSGNGGNITLTAKAIVALNDSDILAFAPAGKGGNITLNTRAFFGQNYRPAPPGTDPRTLDGNGRVDINASGVVSGFVTIPDTTFIQNSLTQLPQVLINTNSLLANSCIVRRNQTASSFFITGSGGLPEKPGSAPISDFPTGEVRMVEGKGARSQESGVRGQNSLKPQWKIGDPIVEPQGIYRLPNGQLVMSRECL